MLKNSIITPGTTVAVLGLGASGRSAVRYARACGARVLVSDVLEKGRFLRSNASFLEEHDLEWEAGGHTSEFLLQADILLPSPGVVLDAPELSSVVDSGKPVYGELAILAARFDVPVVAITGTNGKTTVTTLVAEILRNSGKKVFTGGNIGTPLYEYFLDDGAYELIVAEVSSFQLASSGDFAPDIGMLLNITPDHLDRHHDLHQYIHEKMRLFCNQSPGQSAIINGDDPNCRSLRQQGGVQLYTFGRASHNAMVIEENRILRRDRPGLNLSVATDSLGVMAENFAAAALCLELLNIPAEQLGPGLVGFKPLRHRLELVAEIRGVKYYNDSKATNTGAVVAALNSLPPPVFLIAGGRDKGDDYSLLKNAVKQKVSAILAIGEAAPLLEEALAEETRFIPCSSLEQAISHAATMAAPGASVVLSPACASFDMFTSYIDRGDVFSRLVRAQQEAGP
jgi:UDP-N-acetylmuramoylalanine--D-glutamate ligase